MVKKIKRNASPIQQKRVGHSILPPSGKSPKYLPEVDDIQRKNIGWNFHRMDKGGLWPCTFKKLTKYRSCLISYEKKTVAEVLNARHCHPISCDALCIQAQNRLRSLGLDAGGSLVQLDIGGKARLWGMLHHNIFQLLWIDPQHEVYPTAR